MRVLISPDAYKESLTAAEAAMAIARGFRRVWPEADYVLLPMADGGEGTVAAVLQARRGQRVRVNVTGPLGRRVRASYGWLAGRRTAIIEMAAASGLMLVPPAKRNPLLTTSYGTGELIVHALARGARAIIIGLGGSATIDGGAGMAQALGVRFYDNRGNWLRQKATGGMLEQIARIDISGMHPALSSTRISIAADVQNRLCGRQGAARVFGPQKGAAPVLCRRLDRNLRHFARIIKQNLQIDVLDINGAGAAGGMGAGLVAFTNTGISSGIAQVAKLVGFERRALQAHLIVTGEGRIDKQTGQGKVVAGINRLGRKLGVPVIAIGGSLADDAHALFHSGLAGLEAAVARDMTISDARLHARQYLANAAERAARLLAVGGKLKIKM